MASHGHFAWNELITHDLETAKAFFAAAVGWTGSAMPVPDGLTYWVFEQNGAPVAGLVSLESLGLTGMPPTWFSYLEVDDVDARIKAVEAAGGKVTRPPWDIPNVGRIAVIQDPTGAQLGLMTSVQR
jgi:uncharacterized protein